MDQLKETEEQRQMRRIAFVAVVVSTAAVIASVVTLPMLYNYVQSFQSHLMVETDYCKVWMYLFCFKNYNIYFHLYINI
uniref:Col_cuticle_N domain-containing protein n=1 Tax=Heterorhabditis bacteriophora TaxID=37862 RepID=A0A1I7WSX9_HETBA